MAKRNRQTDGTVAKDSKASQASSEKKLSCAHQVLKDGLRTLDDANDLIRAALIDLETGTSNSSRASQHLKGVDMFIQIKKMMDNRLSIF